MKDKFITSPDSLDAIVEQEASTDSASGLLRQGQLEHLRSALIEAEQSGPSRPFDHDAFKARMRAKHSASTAAR